MLFIFCKIVPWNQAKIYLGVPVSYPNWDRRSCIWHSSEAYNLLLVYYNRAIRTTSLQVWWLPELANYIRTTRLQIWGLPKLWNYITTTGLQVWRLPELSNYIITTSLSSTKTLTKINLTDVICWRIEFIFTYLVKLT